MFCYSDSDFSDHEEICTENEKLQNFANDRNSDFDQVSRIDTSDLSVLTDAHDTSNPGHDYGADEADEDGNQQTDHPCR